MSAQYFRNAFIKRFTLLLLLGSLLAVTSLLMTACTQATDDATLVPTLALQPCRLDGGLEARCGTLSVFEDRATNVGRTIDLNIAVVPATGEATTDPLFVLAGGPGQAATTAFPAALGLFNDIRATRDIVLIDQRGTGQSNGLDCVNLQDESLSTDLSDTEVVALLDECRVALADHADLTRYTTRLATDDLEDVRAALGYDKINLYGVSYGSRAALDYIKRYPEHVRSAVLDAVAGPDLILFDQMSSDGQRSLNQLFERCADDAACHTAFPDVAQEYQSLLTDLETPQQITVEHPLTNEPIEFQLSRELLSQFVFNILYSAEFQSLLPLLIHNAYQTGDFNGLVAQALAISDSAAISTGLLYAVACSEDVPLMDPEASLSDQAETNSVPFAARAQAICKSWPRAEIAADFRDPVVSDLPILLLSGGADPVTPPAYAAAVDQTLSNSLHLMLPGFGHGVLAAGCMPEVVDQFIESGRVAGLDTTCLDGLQPPPFFVSFAGPLP